MSESEFSNTIEFIKQYRKMETASFSESVGFVREVSPEHIADHLCRSWRGRKKDFGDFFLNLSHSTQGDFILAWDIDIEGLDKYKDELRKNPLHAVFKDAPSLISWLHEMLKYFNNHGIGDTASVKLPSLPGSKARFGNSANWGRFILNLTPTDQRLVLEQIYSRYKTQSKVDPF